MFVSLGVQAAEEATNTDSNARHRKEMEWRVMFFGMLSRRNGCVHKAALKTLFGMFWNAVKNDLT
jgi:hypothetical protein